MSSIQDPRGWRSRRIGTSEVAVEVEGGASEP
jgi:hypothetical protein